MTWDMMWCRSSIFALILGTVVNPSDVQADSFPPWVNSYQDIPFGTASSQEYWDFASWYMDHRDDPAVFGSSGYVALQFIAYDLAYPYLNPSNDDPDLAVSLTEQLRIRFFDAKEVVLADLLYGPDGSHPNPERYAYSVRKTALYIASYGGRFMFPFSAVRESEVDPQDLYPELISAYSDRAMRLQAYGKTDRAQVGDNSTLKIAEEVVAALPEAIRYLNDTDSCALLQEGITHWYGTQSIEADHEFGEILLRAVDSRIGLEVGVAADTNFYLGLLASEFEILDEAGAGASYFGLSSANGHPKASYQYGRYALSIGNIEEAAESFQIAALQGHQAAINALNEIQKTHANLPTTSQREYAENIASEYQQTRCHDLVGR